MVSKKVFCGAIRPRITGIRDRVEPRLSRRSEPWLSDAVVTKPGRNLDVAPGAPPNPWRRAPSRDTRDSTVQNWPATTEQVIQAKRRNEELLEAGGERTEGWRDGGTAERMVTFTHECAAMQSLFPPPLPSLSLFLSCTNTFFSLNTLPFQQCRQTTFLFPNGSSLFHPFPLRQCFLSSLSLWNLSSPLTLWCSDECLFKAGKLKCYIVFYFGVLLMNSFISSTACHVSKREAGKCVSQRTKWIIYNQNVLKIKTSLFVELWFILW